jgi:hypothetical protein
MNTITVPRAVLEQVLEALIHMCHNTFADKGYDGQLVQDAIDGLKGALEQKEPVALCDPAEYDDFQGAVSRNQSASRQS